MPQSIQNLITLFNQGWARGKFEQVADVLHEDVVFISPDFQSELKGREACLQTIREYAEHASTQHFELKEAKVNTWKNTAVATITYYIEYEMNAQLYKETGIEAWTLIRENGDWKIVWRGLVSNE